MKSNDVLYLRSLFKRGVIDICIGEGNFHFITINGSYIKLNTAFYELLEAIKFEHELYEFEILINSTKFKDLCKLFKKKESEKNTHSYIYFKVTIFNKSIVNFISKYLSILFLRNSLIYILPISILINFTYFYYNGFQFSKIDFNPVDFLNYYLILILIMIIHELGHSSASKYYGIYPSDIGFGVYVFFPVFFANVTSIWLLSKYKRILVNIGGVYFQLLLNVFLIIFNYFSHTNVLIAVISMNFFVAFYSLIPFLRNDGYWIYSDYFNLPNLSVKSRLYSLKVIMGFIKKNNMTVNYHLFIYSIGNSFFLLYIVFNYLKVLEFNISTINIYSDTYTILIKSALIIVTTFFFILFIKRYMFYFFKQFKVYFYGKKI